MTIDNKLKNHITNEEGKETLAHGNDMFHIGMHKTIYQIKTPESPQIAMLPHWHDEFEFFFLSQGECKLYMDSIEYEIHSGEAVFIPSNIIHWVEAKETVVYYAVVFGPEEFSSGYVNDTIRYKYINPIIERKVLIGPRFCRETPWQKEILDKLIDIMAMYDYAHYNITYNSLEPSQTYFRGDVVFPELKIKSLLFDIIIVALENSESGIEQERPSEKQIALIQNAIDYMHKHYNEKITLTELAAHICVSKGYFNFLFKNSMHCQPFVYLNKYRIKKSIELLENTDLRIIEIASRCGFEQIGYFNRKFMEYMKCTPSEYRKGIHKQ